MLQFHIIAFLGSESDTLEQLHKRTCGVLHSLNKFPLFLVDSLPNQRNTITNVSARLVCKSAAAWQGMAGFTVA